MIYYGYVMAFKYRGIQILYSQTGPKMPWCQKLRTEVTPSCSQRTDRQAETTDPRCMPLQHPFWVQCSPCCFAVGSTEGGGSFRDHIVRSAGPLGLSNASKCSWMGCTARRCRESFWLREMVSKQRTAPELEMIQGTFSLDTLEMTSSFNASLARLNRSQSPDLVDGASFSLSLLTTEDMKMKP
jgi:hypothetical protein